MLKFHEHFTFFAKNAKNPADHLKFPRLLELQKNTELQLRGMVKLSVRICYLTMFKYLVHDSIIIA